MYFVNYNHISKNKFILKEPLEDKFKKKKISILEKIFKKELYFKSKIYNKIIEDYNKERLFIVNNKEKIINELNEIDYESFYSIEHSSNNYIMDYIRDFFKINTIGEKTSSKYLNRLKRFFYFNELLFYIENDLVTLDKKDNVILIKAKYEQAYKRKWFATVWDELSKETMMIFSIFFNITLTNEKLLEPLDIFTKYFLDKVFFINIDYITKDGKKDPNFKYIYKVCKFFVLLHLVKNNSININDTLIDELDFNQNNFLEELILNQEKLHLLDKGFMVIDNNIHLINSNDIYNTLKNAVFQKYKDKNSLSTKLGKTFQKYVHKYCYENFSQDYEIIIKPINLDGLKGYENKKLDIDMVLYDKEKDFYYFTQIKYTLIHKSYLIDEIKYLGDNTAMDTAKKQLENIPEFLNYKDFQNKLLENNINIKNNNYALIIIHTTPQYDFQKIDNIQLYEWNNFRNLLKKGYQHTGNINLYQPSFTDIQNNETLELDCVDKVISISIKNNPTDIESSWNNFYETFENFEINNQKYSSNIK